MIGTSDDADDRQHGARAGRRRIRVVEGRAKREVAQEQEQQHELRTSAAHPRPTTCPTWAYPQIEPVIER